MTTYFASLYSHAAETSTLLIVLMAYLHGNDFWSISNLYRSDTALGCITIAVSKKFRHTESKTIRFAPVGAEEKLT